MKILWLVLGLTGCARVNGHVTLRPTWWPEEEHGGASGRRAASDLYFMAAGATFDAGLLALKVKPVPRLAADMLAAIGMRTWKPLGRTEGSGLMFLVGVSVTQFVSFFACHGPCHR